jgi:membrane associated rhomboid family serine protease
VTLSRLRAVDVIAVVTAVAWLAAQLIGMDRITAAGGFIPARIGGLVDVPGALPVWLTPFSATLIHADALHLAFNLLMLVWTGRQVEQALGPKLVIALYAVGAIAAAAAQWSLGPSSVAVTIGASGAISAIVAVYALVFSEQRVKAIGPIPPHVVRALWLGAAWIGIQLLIGLGFGMNGSGIALGAHVGGFVAGLLLARPMLRWRFKHR